MSYPLCRFTGNAFNSLFHLGIRDVRRLVKRPTQRTCWYRMIPWTQLAMKLGFGLRDIFCSWSLMSSTGWRPVRSSSKCVQRSMRRKADGNGGAAALMFKRQYVVDRGGNRLSNSSCPLLYNSYVMYLITSHTGNTWPS